MSANKKAPAVPYVVMEEGPSRSLVDQGSCYLTSARALMDFVMEDLNVATDQMWGVYHLLCLAEKTIEAAQIVIAKGGK
ncbi:hypothetical protein C7E18_04805 [Stenotrophomonas maltophilia]|nr:hypothetical protein C7E18_04805 [Stenotrophomonas maltophilia]